MKKVGIGLVVVAGVVLLVAFILYNKPHRNPAKESGISVSSQELFSQYERNEEEANKLYLDKVVEVSGLVSEVVVNQEQKLVIVLESHDAFFGVRCTMSGPAESIEKGMHVTVKGICTGYLSDVIVTNASMIK